MNWFNVTKSLGLIEMFPVVSTFGIIIIISSFCVTSFGIQIQTDKECDELKGEVHELPNSEARYCCKKIKCPSDHTPKICNDTDINSTGCLPCPDKTWNEENWSIHMRECVPKNDRFNPMPVRFFTKETAPNLKSTNIENTSVLTKVSAAVLTEVSADMTEAYDHKQFSLWMLVVIVVVGAGVAVFVVTLIVICIMKRQNVNAFPEKESRSSFSNFSASSNDSAMTDGFDCSSHHLLDSNKKCADLHQGAPSTAGSSSLNLQSTPVSNQDNVSSNDDRLNRPLNPSEMKQTDIESLNLMLMSDPISSCSNSPVEFVSNNPLENVNSFARQDFNSHISSLSHPAYDHSNLDLREDDLPSLSPSDAYTVVVDGDNRDAQSGTALHGEATNHTTIQIPDTSGNNLQIDYMKVNGPVNIYMQR